MDPTVQQPPQEVPQPISPQTPQQEKIHSSIQKPLWIILSIIAVLGIIGGACYLVAKKKSATIISEKKSVTVSQSQSSTSVPSPTASGRVYTNKQFGYTIIYPVDWQAVESPPIPVTYPPISEQPQYGGYLQKGELQKTTFVNPDIGSCALSVLDNSKHMDLAQWSSSYKVLSANGANLAKVTGNTIMGGSPAKIISIFAFDHSNTAIVTEQTNNIYFFEYANTKGNPNYTTQQQSAETLCLQIASSLHFQNVR